MYLSTGERSALYRLNSIPVKEARPIVHRRDQMTWQATKIKQKQTLKPIRRIHTVVFHSLLVWVCQCIQDNEHKNVKAHIRNISQRLDYDIGQIVVRHDLTNRH
jgi:hypothetical protein